jgi:hypothetical protein
MQAITFVLTLIEDLRRILRSFPRMLALPKPSEPATSDRVFRIACPVSGQVLKRSPEAGRGRRTGGQGRVALGAAAGLRVGGRAGRHRQRCPGPVRPIR